MEINQRDIRPNDPEYVSMVLRDARTPSVLTKPLSNYERGILAEMLERAAKQ